MKLKKQVVADMKKMLSDYDKDTDNWFELTKDWDSYNNALYFYYQRKNISQSVHTFLEREIVGDYFGFKRRKK